MMLAGDIGGTKVNLGVFETAGNTLRLAETATFLTRDYSGISEILSEFITSTGRPQEVLSLGVAGPVTGSSCRLTNIDWEIDAGSLKQELGFSEVLLVNDLAAGAAGLPFLREGDVQVLQPGRPDSNGRKAIVSAGTGLGQAFLIPEAAADRWLIVDTEGGQCGLSAYCIEDLEIMQYFHGLGSPVAVEHVLSGEGLVRLFQYYHSRQGRGDGRLPALDLTAEEIVVRSRNEERGPCREAVNRFASFLGGVAGDLALQGLATGGIYLGGGIAPAISHCLAEGSFLKSFNNRDKFHGWMKTVPVYLILNERSPLWGAAELVVGGRVVMARH